MLTIKDYLYYQPVSFQVRAELKKISKEMDFDLKKTPWQKIWADFLASGIIIPDLTTPIILLEQHWFKNPACYMPESQELIQQLSETNFEGQIKALKTPAETFTIALPKVSKFNHQRINGLFVAYMLPEKITRSINRFNQTYGTNLELNLEGKQDPKLFICYGDPDGSGRLVLNLDLWQLEWVLSAQNIDEFKEMTHINSDSIISFSLSQNEQKTQFEILRFIVSFIVYMSAHDDAIQFIKNFNSPGLNKRTAPVALNAIKQFKPKDNMKPFYRNLRHDKYYQGQYATWERGSRWVPVNMSPAEVKGK